MKQQVKITTLEKILDILYPCYCWGCGRRGEIFCARCHNYNRQNNPPFSFDFNDFMGEVFVCGLREGLLKKMIHEYKFSSRRELARVFVMMVSEILPKKNYVVVPLPTIERHIRVRGFDHIGLLSEKLASITGFPVLRVIERAKNTVQVGTDRDVRIKQANEAYVLKTGVEISPDIDYLLIDDVWTTGASMRAAAEVLRGGGAKKIDAVVLAKNTGYGDGVKFVE